VPAKRWFTTAPILPRGSCSLFRELPSFSLPTAGLLAQVCQLPLSLWLLSASWPPTSCARASPQATSGVLLFSRWNAIPQQHDSPRGP
jgi:hypothetical protein